MFGFSRRGQTNLTCKIPHSMKQQTPWCSEAHPIFNRATFHCRGPELSPWGICAETFLIKYISFSFNNVSTTLPIGSGNYSS